MSMEVRSRQKAFQSMNGRENSKSRSQMIKSERPLRRLTLRKCLFLVTVIFLVCFSFKFIFGRYPLRPHHHAADFADKISTMMGFQRLVYAIMFDAGSTGSRILVFTFHRVHADGNLKLDKEFFEEIKPGLSSYSDDPVKAAESLRPLLEKAKLEIPKSAWAQTPIVLKATAGLRLLPDDKAEAILLKVRELFLEYPFLVTDESVSIMDGKDEGLFSWFTVNFLLDTLSKEDKNMFASLDLGGGSTQVTLVANKETLSKASGDVRDVVIFDKSVNLYIHSYLGLGLMAARLEILKSGNEIQNAGHNEFTSPCIHSEIKTNWNYNNNDYIIKGKVIKEIPPIPNSVPVSKKRVLRFERCLEVASKIINDKVYAPPELQDQNVYAMSYYFDRATDGGLIDPFKGGEVTVADFFEIAKSACTHPNAEQPFVCLDLTYISALLNKGLGLKPDKKIMLKKKINDHELSWALGAAFHVLANADFSQL